VADADHWAPEPSEREKRRRRNLGAATGCGCLTLTGACVVVGIGLLMSLSTISCELTAAADCANSDDPLVLAASSGDLREVDDLVAGGHDPGQPDADGNRPLPCAVGGDHVAVVEALLDAGADPEGLDRGGRLPLTLAVESGQVDIGAALLDAGARPDGLGSQIPLVTAVERGGGPFVELLLDAGADPDGRGGRGPLARAAGAGWTAVCDLLLAAGADPDRPDLGTTPLVAAMDAPGDDALAIVDLLLAAGADAQQPSARADEPLSALIAGERSSDESSYHTPLFRAAFARRADLVNRLLEAGADPDDGGDLRFSSVGLTLLNVMDRYGVALEAPEARGLLHPTAVLTADDRSNVPPLVVAAMNDDRFTVMALLGGDADPDASAFDAYTPLYAAAWVGNEPTVRALLAAGADPSPRPPNMTETPLGAARARGHAEVIATLEAAGAT
jgi:ankyrin repeat protein